MGISTKRSLYTHIPNYGPLCWFTKLIYECTTHFLLSITMVVVPFVSNYINITVCCFAGLWGAWVLQGSCSTTCESGLQTRTRVCDNPPPEPGSLECLMMDGVERALDETDTAFPCDLGTCEGNNMVCLYFPNFNIVQELDPKICPSL